MLDAFIDALLDTLKLFPFLFLMYVFIEVLEHNTKIGKPNRALSGKCAPLIGTATGLVPLCGFSVMAAKLYRHRHVTIGTLFAVFIATNDEAILVLLLSNNMGWIDKAISLAALLGIKFALGVSVGYLVDFLHKKRAPVLTPAPQEEHFHEDEHDHEHDHDHEGEHEEHEHFSACEHAHQSKWHLYLLAPLLHSLLVAAFILVVNLAFGFLFVGIGEDKVVAFLQSGYWFQPFIACVVGLIPNCASSVVLTETYSVGGIAFGSLIAGLVVNAGLGYLVLFRDFAKWKKNLCILATTFLLGLITGYAINAIALVI